MAARWEPPADPDLALLLQTAILNWKHDKPKVIAFDTETTGLEYHDTAFCVSLAWHSPDDTFGNGIHGYYVELAEPQAFAFLHAVFDVAETIVGHNLAFDLHRAEAAGFFTPDMWAGKRFDDTEAMSHLDDEHRRKGLKSLAVEVLGEEDIVHIPRRRQTLDGNGEVVRDENGKKVMEDYLKAMPREEYEMGQAKEWAKKKHGIDSVDDVGYDLLPRGTVVPYAIKDAEWTLRLAAELYPRIIRYPDLFELYEREVWNTTRGCAYEMTRAGMQVRTQFLEDKIREYRKLCIGHELEIERIVGKPVRRGKIPPKERADYFNPGSSSPDAGAYLTACGFPRESYDADNLKGIDHPLADKLLVYRKDTKLLDGYFVSLKKALGPDGIFHMSLRYHGTVSGRTSAGAEQGDG